MDADEPASGSNGSASSCDSEVPSAQEDAEPLEESDAQELLKNAEWIAPKRGQLVHVLRNVDDAASQEDGTPLCRGGAFMLGFVRGRGEAGASALHRRWCPACLHRVGRVRQREARMQELLHEGGHASASG